MDPGNCASVRERCCSCRSTLGGLSHQVSPLGQLDAGLESLDFPFMLDTVHTDWNLVYYLCIGKLIC